MIAKIFLTFEMHIFAKKKFLDVITDEKNLK